MRPKKGRASAVYGMLLACLPISAHASGEQPQYTSGQLTASAVPAYWLDSESDDQRRPAIQIGRAVDLAGKEVGLIGQANSAVSSARLPYPDRFPPEDVFTPGLPLKNVRLTSGFGTRWHPTLGSKRFHSGVDLKASMGMPVYAASSGKVEMAGQADGYGIMVSIQHAEAMQTRYAHLSALAVEAGERVEQGQIIGYVGSTGRSTGPHLHFEMRQAGRPVDPVSYWSL